MDAHSDNGTDIPLALREFGACDDRVDYLYRGAAIQNFGDYLPELFFKTLLTHPKIDADVFRLVGSVIEESWIGQDLSRATGLTQGIIAYWGCGCRSTTPIDPELLAHCRFFGVRGPKTRDVLGLPADTTLGDPGLLAPLMHTPTRHPETSGKVICMPHMHDPKSLDEILELSGAEVLVHPEIEGTEAGLLEIIDKIASAEFVLTASLHGAIIAFAYGVPFCFWDNGHVDAPFKWEDFSQSVNMPAVFARDVAEGRRIYAEQLKPVMRPLPLAPILDGAPFVPTPQSLLAALAFDGAIDRATADAAIGALNGLPGASMDVRVELQNVSSENRKLRHSVKAQLGGRIGKLARDAARSLPPELKRGIRKIAARSS